MASVKTFHGGSVFYACYRGADGRRRQESTGKTNREDALAIALAYERAAAEARSGTLADERARSFLAQCHAISGNSCADAIAVDLWLRRWARHTGRRLKPKSARKYADVIESFLTSLGADAKVMLASIRTRHVVAWRDAMIDRGRAPKTANVALAILAQAFREAQAQQLCERNPCAGLRLRNADTGNTRRQPFTLDQFHALLAATTGEWRMFILLLGCTGARQQEAAQIRWDQIDFDHDRVTLIRGKQRGRPHVVPMHPALRARLEADMKQAASVFVLPRLAAQEGKALSKHFRCVILKKIGIIQPYGGRPGGHVAARYSLHSLRHSLASWADAAGFTAAQRRDLLGHDSGLINERYTHTTLDALAAQLQRIALADVAS